MIRPRTALLVLAPLLLHALAREADRGLGLLLRAEIEPLGLLSEVGRAVAADGPAAAGRVGLWLVAGIGAWLALAWWNRRAGEATWDEALRRQAVVFAPLLLRPALSALALVSVAARPSYPYGFTLPVALTQDWGIGQDVAALAAILALRLPALRFPGPRAVEVFALAFLAYAVFVPEWAWRWEGHPGNEPKYLRQAVALGHGLTFDAEGVSATMEELPVRSLAASLPAAALTFPQTLARDAKRSPQDSRNWSRSLGRPPEGRNRTIERSTRSSPSSQQYPLAAIPASGPRTTPA